MNDDSLTVKRAVLSIQILYGALMGGLVFISLVLVLLVVVVLKKPLFEQALVDQFHWMMLAAGAIVVLLAAVIGKWLPDFINQKQVDKTQLPSINPYEPGWDVNSEETLQALNSLPKNEMQSLIEKFNIQSIIRAALLEGAGMINALFFMMTGEWLHVGWIGVSLIILALSFPTVKQFAELVKKTQYPNAS